MATAIVMMAGAVLNATAFVGGSYLAKYLSHDKHSDVERIRHDKALEKYQHDMGEYEKKRQAYMDLQAEQYINKKQADSNLQDTDRAFDLYGQAHPEPQFSDYYRPSSKQKQYEMLYVGGGMLAAGYAASKLFI